MARLTLNGMYQYDPTLFDGMILPEDYDREALFAEIMTRCGQMYPYHQVSTILKSNIRLWFSRNFLNFDRMMAALTAEYDPIENYNRHELWTRTPNLTDEQTNTGKDTTELSGTDSTELSGTDSTELSGTDSTELSGIDSTELSGTDSTELSGTDSTELSGDDTTTRSYDGYNETSTRTGDDTTERQVSAYDSGTYQNAEKTVETFGSIADSKNITGSYDDKTDYGKKEDLTYGKKEDLTYGKKEDLTYGKKEELTHGHIITDRHTGNEQYANHTHGNIGVTTTQQMITQELELRKYDVYVDISERFEREFLVQVY